jgi:TldD protein
MRRRSFLQGTAASAMIVSGCAPKSPAVLSPTVTFSDPLGVRLADVALQVATEAGASYADIRIGSRRSQSVATREARVEGVSDSESAGFGIRVIADGAWGFAASSTLTEAEVAIVARRAVEMARARAKLVREPIQLAPVEAVVDRWETPITKDGFTVPLQEKVDLLLSINALALKVPGVSFCSAWLDLIREDKYFASTDGSRIEQRLHRCFPSFEVTAVGTAGFQSRESLSAPQGRGYEYVLGYPWLEDAERAGHEAVEKLSARSVEPGRKDLVLLPSHLWLTIHESVGHPTELDRALGHEANFAGTSFLTPDKLGTHRFASPLCTFRAERTAPGSLATAGYDDDGVRTMEWDLVKEGIFVDYQTTRDQAHWIGRDHSTACSTAMTWKHVAFQRMPNVNLVPGKEPMTLDGLVAGVEDGILIAGSGSYSIDHQRYNFQFGGQVFHEIKNGKVGAMLRDVAYQGTTTEFWNACDGIADASAYEVNGSLYDGKGEPGQSNAMSHGTSPARFRGISILNTAREA